MTAEQRIREYPGHLIPKGDALAILRDHPARDAVDMLPCAGNHNPYCCGIVVDKQAVLDEMRAVGANTVGGVG